MIVGMVSCFIDCCATGNPEQAAMWLEEGFTFVAVDMDLSILAREADRIRALYKD